MKQQLGNLYGLRIGREYGFRQCKQELGWTNYRFTNFEQINRWWEIIFSAYWMVSSHCSIFRDLNPSQALSDSNLRSQESIADYTFHPQWSNKGWKTTLNNFRLIIQPAILFWAIIPRARHFS